MNISSHSSDGDSAYKILDVRGEVIGGTNQRHQGAKRSLGNASFRIPQSGRIEITSFSITTSSCFVMLTYFPMPSDLQGHRQLPDLNAL